MEPSPPPASPPPGGPRFPAEAPPAKKKPGAAKVLLILLVAVVVLGGGGCATCVCLGLRGAHHMKEQDDADRDAAREVPVAELLSAYKGDQARADGLYKGKWIVVTDGRIEGSRKTLGDQAYLVIGTGKPEEVPGVQCLLQKSQDDKAAALSKGDPVRVRGRVHGLLLNVVLERCEIL